ncbi:hypothetical protein BT93_I1334 [Corymbia citriodora subsp. variegata]|nr:hypothetical protein BT93_I1334 [Corymbia citriodora subsp. variegata]
MTSTIFGLCTTEISLSAMGPQRGHEFRCVQWKILLETLEKELPSGTIKFSSKLLIGSDGVNSAVAKWLGFKKPAFVGRIGIRACPKISPFMGKGVRYGVIPCDDKTMYWFFSFSPSSQVLSKLGKVADNIKAVIDDTELDNMMLSPLRFRYPWDIIWGNISCAALEDGVTLARCLGEALRDRQVMRSEGKGMEEEDEYKRIEMGLRNYAKEQRWRAFQLITTAYMVGYMAQSDGKILNFLSNTVLAGFLAGQLPRIASYNCGKLGTS